MREPQKMTKTRFDNIIRENVEKEARERGEEVQLGYIINGKPYDDYYSKTAFDAFLYDMEHNYEPLYKRIKECSGSETLEKDNNPPKMASVASSSRFCYLALRDGFKELGINNVTVEEKCSIKDMRGNVNANLDAYCQENNTYIEAKCHEIFDTHTDKMSGQYRKHLKSEFHIDVDVEDESEVALDFKDFGVEKENPRFDIKQLLCHLLGIKNVKGKEPATLMYLFFKPIAEKEQDNDLIDEVFAELEAEMERIFNSKPIKTFAEENNIKLMAVIENEKVMKSLNGAKKKIIMYN